MSVAATALLTLTVWTLAALSIVAMPGGGDRG